MGIFDIIGAAILLAILIGCCLCCTKACQRKKRPENRRKRRRQQKNARRKRRRQQRNCPAPHTPLPTNPQTQIQITNPAPQQLASAPIPPPQMPPPGYQTTSPHQLSHISSSHHILQFHNQQYPNPPPQSPQTQQFAFAQQHLPHATAQPGDLYPFPPPPYEPPDQMPTQRQLETRIAILNLDINQFARPPPPPYDEELQRSEPFKLN